MIPYNRKKTYISMWYKQNCTCRLSGFHLLSPKETEFILRQWCTHIKVHVEHGNTFIKCKLPSFVQVMLSSKHGLLQSNDKLSARSTCNIGFLCSAFLSRGRPAATEWPLLGGGDGGLEGDPATLHPRRRRRGVHGLEPRGGGRGEAARHGNGIDGSRNALWPLAPVAAKVDRDYRATTEERWRE